MARNILNVITSILDGGLERHVYYIIKHKQNQSLNHSVIVLTGERDNELTRKYHALNISIRYLNLNNRFNILAIPGNLVQIIKLAYLIRRNKIEVIHSHDFFPAFVARVSACLSFIFFFKRIKRIYITLHIVFFWLSSLHHFINRTLAMITSKIVCLSYAILNYSHKSDKIPLEKYTIIYTGVDTSRFVPDNSLKEEYLAEFGLNNNNFILGNIGVLSIRKGQLYLLKAFNELYPRYPDLRLLIFGSEREHELEIKEGLYTFIEENNLGSVIKIIPPREDINRIYNIFDIFVMPSITEGLSACSIEALLMEKICLFSDIEPFKELVNDKENGFLFKNKDFNDLKVKLEYIIQNYNKLGKMKKDARNSAEGKFDLQKMVAKYEELYLT